MELGVGGPLEGQAYFNTMFEREICLSIFSIHQILNFMTDVADIVFEILANN